MAGMERRHLRFLGDGVGDDTGQVMKNLSEHVKELLLNTLYYVYYVQTGNRAVASSDPSKNANKQQQKKSFFWASCCILFQSKI